MSTDATTRYDSSGDALDRPDAVDARPDARPDAAPREAMRRDGVDAVDVRGPRREATTDGHLEQVDLFRILTFAAVVAVHSFAFTNPSESVSANAVAMLLHFTREAFFVLTGFVLVYAQRNRTLVPTRFWGRRFRLIGVPYLVWTVIYWAYGELLWPDPDRGPLQALGLHLVDGQAKYHLYFLLVSMQVYLVFPLLLPWLRRWRSRPWVPLTVAAVVQVGLTLWLQLGDPPSTGLRRWVADHAYEILPTYLLYIVAGGLVALHLATAQAWLLRHRRAVTAVAVATGVAAEAVYFAKVWHGAPPGAEGASDVLQPVMIVWSFGAVALLALAGCTWDLRRVPGGRGSRVLQWCSSASFGVYLVHPLVLDGVLELGLHGPDPSLVPQPWASLVAWSLTLAGSVAIVAVLRKTPLSLPLTGRARPRGGTPAARR